MAESGFKLHADFAPAGHQPEAIRKLLNGLERDRRHQTLLGVTGSGKTFVMANLIAQWGRPALVLSHNKTLTAQLFAEFRHFFPENAVEYFVSYYDYYQPEAYLPATDVYIEKDSAINDSLDRLRLAATSALMTRRDVVVVASVSCIYGLGRPEEYGEAVLQLISGQESPRRGILERLIAMQYTRNDLDFQRGTFRVRGDAVEIWPAYRETAVRVELFGDEVEELVEFVPLTGEVLNRYSQLVVFPATHFVLAPEKAESAIAAIESELDVRLKELRAQDKLLEAQRLESRTRYDIEMVREIGYCQGIENYSRHFDGRAPGERPACLFDYFRDKDWLLLIDESHVTLPQVRGMYNGDQARKKVLVDHGFRLPSALDNRPMKWEEFLAQQPYSVYVSATPAPFEVERSEGEVVELLVRPTGLIDPPVEVRPTKNQVDDIMREIAATAEAGQRTLVTTLTKRLAEDLDEYCRERGLRTMYLHSDVKTIERVEILKNLRLGAFDALIGVNLLREGLDLPEVSRVIILDADKQGFLRSATSLIQTIGRCARHLEGRVILYADSMSGAMAQALEETTRRREVQLAYNREHNITPRSVVRGIETGLEEFFAPGDDKSAYVPALGGNVPAGQARLDEIALLQEEMVKASEEMRFEDAAYLRDRLLELGAPIKYESAPAAPPRPNRGGRKPGAGRKKRG